MIINGFTLKVKARLEVIDTKKRHSLPSRSVFIKVPQKKMRTSKCTFAETDF